MEGHSSGGAGSYGQQASQPPCQAERSVCAADKLPAKSNRRGHHASHTFPPLQELKAKEQVAALKLEISGLTKLLEQGAAVGLAEEADLEELIRRDKCMPADTDHPWMHMCQPGCVQSAFLN
jgi:hypothetical protein